MKTSIHPRIRLASALVAVLLGLSLPASAAVLYGVAGSTYEQNFDTLTTATNSDGQEAPWANDTTLPGWYYALTSGAEPAFYRATNGQANQNVALSLGTNGSTDRALGSQSANTVPSSMRYALELTNTTGSTLSQFTLTYTGEQWRVIGGDPQDELIFEYQIFPAGTDNNIGVSTGWTEVANLNFTAPQTATGSTSLDGNDAANSETLSATVTGVNWTDGSELWLRWSDSNIGDDSRAQMGVDDLSFSAVPEPGTSAMLLGGLGLLFGSRRFRRPVV